MAKTGHPNFDYTCQGYWRGAIHNFSIVGNHSGTSFGQSDAQAFMEGTSSPFALTFGPLMSSGLSVVASRYYDGQNSAPVFVNLYNTGNPAPTPLVPTGAAWGSDITLEDYLPLEVCADLSSEVGLGKTSKPVYNRKFLRGVPQGAVGSGTGGETVWGSPAPAAVVTAVAKLGNGDWYGGRTYISPNARSANNWLISAYPGNHQIPRGRKAKATSTSSSLFNDALNLAKAAAEAAAL